LCSIFFLSFFGSEDPTGRAAAKELPRATWSRPNPGDISICQFFFKKIELRQLQIG